MGQENEHALQQVLAWLNPFINQPQYRATINTLLQQTIAERTFHHQSAYWLPGIQAEL